MDKKINNNKINTEDKIFALNVKMTKKHSICLEVMKDVYRVNNPEVMSTIMDYFIKNHPAIEALIRNKIQLLRQANEEMKIIHD